MGRNLAPFGQVILAAADVDADVFRQLSAAYAEVASRTTLYVSKRDQRQCHDGPSEIRSFRALAWVVFEVGSGSSKAEQGPLVGPGKRQT